MKEATYLKSVSTIRWRDSLGKNHPVMLSHFNKYFVFSAIKHNNIFILYQEVLLHFNKYFILSAIKHENIFIVY